MEQECRQKARDASADDRQYPDRHPGFDLAPPLIQPESPDIHPVKGLRNYSAQVVPERMSPNEPTTKEAVQSQQQPIPQKEGSNLISSFKWTQMSINCIMNSSSFSSDTMMAELNEKAFKLP